MVKLRERLIRLACLAAVASFIAALTVLDPGAGLAKPYDSGPSYGDPYGSGTRLRIPAEPTPANNLRSAKSGIQTTPGRVEIRRVRDGSSPLRWISYFKLVVRLGIR
jgi:hypothetical protein